MTKAKICIVDDDLNMLQTMTILLEAEGHEVIPYHAAASAIVDIAAEKPDVVVTDINMPGLDGLEMIAELKETHELTKTSFVVVSANETEAWKEKARKAGSDCYITKPIEPATFGNHINYFLRK